MAGQKKTSGSRAPKVESGFAAWLKGSKGEMPKAGVPGVQTDWFDVGAIEFGGSNVAVVDLWMLWVDEDTVAVKLPAGRYAVRAKGIAFGAHRRVASVRVSAEGVDVAVGKELGEIGVDSWGIAIGEVEAWHQGLDDEQVGAFNEAHVGVYANGCEIVEWEIGGKRACLVIAFTGMGDGLYPVRATVFGKKTVGLEVEFIENGFSLE
jgi:hypothetical protein